MPLRAERGRWERAGLLSPQFIRQNITEVITLVRVNLATTFGERGMDGLWAMSLELLPLSSPVLCTM